MSPVRRQRLAIAAALAIIALVHGCLLWQNSPTTSYRYEELAQAFSRGQTHRIDPPADALLSLADPYDAAANQEWREHDLILFEGKYYFYWGPAPALLITPLKWLMPSLRIGDACLAWIFAQLTLLALALMLTTIQRRCFAAASHWPILVALLAAGLATPMPFLFARPSIYEAAILGGQCFLMLATMVAIRALNADRSKNAKLVLVGVLASLGVCSRLNLAPAVGVLALLLLWELHRRATARTYRAFAMNALALGVPLLMSALAMGLYNHARFGSFRETGIRHMLASRPGRTALQRGQAFSTRYVATNLQNYLVAPIEFGASPLVVPRRAIADDAPRYWRSDIVAGLLVASPVYLLGLIPIVTSARELSRNRGTWLTAALAIASAVALALPVLMFFYCSIRYLADFTPALAVLVAVGAWSIHQPAFRAITIALLAWSCLVGVGLAVSGYPAAESRPRPGDRAGRPEPAQSGSPSPRSPTSSHPARPFVHSASG